MKSRPFSGLLRRDDFLQVYGENSFAGLVWRKDFRQVFYGEKTFCRSSMERGLLQVVLWRNDLQNVFNGKNTHCRSSMEKKSLLQVFYGEKYLLQVFYGEKTLFMASIERRIPGFFMEKRPAAGVLWRKGLVQHFYGEKTF